jgi:hypothetical protein
VPTTDSAKLRRKRCLNCNKLFVPARNVPNQKFDKDHCRKEFHRHGSAFGPMKLGLHKAIEKKYAELEVSIKLRFREAHTRMEALTVEASKLRAQVDTLRGQFEKHSHQTDADGYGNMSTPVVDHVFV